MSSGRPILLLTETGFVIRNLLLGSFAARVAGTRRLLVAVQDPDDPNLADVARGKDIVLIDFPFEPYKESRKFWKRYFSWDNWIYCIGYSRKPPNSRATQARLYEGLLDWRIKILYRFSVGIGFLLNLFRLSGPVEKRYLSKYISEKPITQNWKKILKEIDPSLVVSSMLTHSSRFRCSTDLPVVVAAHELGIKTCTLVQSWDNLSSKTSLLPAWVDGYFTWSQSMSEELLQFNPGVSRKKVKVVGSPQYDFHRESSLLIDRKEYCHQLGLDPLHPYVLIGTGTAKWMPDEMEKMIRLVEIVHRDLQHVQVVIRLHPKDHGDRWKPYLADLKARNIFIQYSSPEVHMDKGGFVPPRDFYREQINVIYHSAVVINSSSSLTVDAAIFDRPVICIGYDIRHDPLFPEGRSRAYSMSSHFSKLVATGGVPVAHDEEECVLWIRKYLDEPATHREERKKIVALVTGGIIGNSGLELAKEVLALSDEP